MRKFQRQTAFLAMFVAALFMMVALFVGHANAAYSVKQQWVRFSVTAGEDLSTGDVVCIKDADGEAYKADANDAALRPAVGIVGLAADDGYAVEIITAGILRGWTSLSEGAYAYLSETAGAVTQTAPTSWQQPVAVAISTTEYLFDFSGPVDSYFTVSLSVNGQETATLDPAATFQMPMAATLIEVSVAARDIDTADADETYTVDIEEAGASVLSAAIPITVDNTPVVGTVSDSAIADNAKVEAVVTLGGTTPTIDDLTILLTFKSN